MAFSSVGTQLDLGTATIQAVSGFSSIGTQIDAGSATITGVSAFSSIGRQVILLLKLLQQFLVLLQSVRK